ncbi:MAG: 2-oxo-4-hydroxy-4-carboxy-5-ureidoimidazoline decarboxylase [Gemmatimonadaceae bacterium]
MANRPDVRPTPIQRLNSLDTASATAVLHACCGSREWARRVASGRPFSSDDALFEAADTTWRDADPVDWREAFGQHPRIGEDRPAGAAQEPVTRPKTFPAWSKEEQSGMQVATGTLRAEFAQANRTYESRFGYIFIVCATGMMAEEMLAQIRTRLRNDPETELRVAAEEQGKITRLRLEKLLASWANTE